MKKIYFIMLIAFFSLKSSGQSFFWAKAIQETNGNGVCIIHDKDENIITAGSLNSNQITNFDFDFGPGVFYLTPGQFQTNAYIAKYTPMGELLWAKLLFNATHSNSIFDIKADKAGNVFLLGKFQGDLDFDPGPGIYSLNYPPGGLFIEKLDSNGNFLWVKSNCGPNGITGNPYFELDKSGNPIIFDSFEGALDFDPGPGTYYMNVPPLTRQMYLWKLNTNGDFIFAKQFESPNNSVSASSICIDKNNNINLGGGHSQYLDADPGPGIYPMTGGYYYNFIIRLDSLAQFIFAKQFKPLSALNTTLTIKDLKTDSHDNLIYIGQFKDSVDFSTGAIPDVQVATSQNDFFVSKLDSNGNYQWTKTITNQNGITTKRLIIGSLDYLYILGRYFGSTDFDPGPGIYMLSDNSTYTLKLNNSGGFESVLSFGSNNGNGNIIGDAFSKDSNNHFYLTGYFGGTQDFDPSAGVYNLSGAPGGGTCIFIDKFNFCDEYRDTTITACNSINIWGIHYDSSKHFVKLFLSSSECDSNYSVHLTMNYSVTDTIHPIACNSYTINNTTYTTSGLYVQNYPIGAACDSLFVIDLSIQNPGNLSVIQNQDTLKAYPSGYAYQWFDCGTNQPILGATDSFFIPQVAGSYKFVMYFGNNCNDSSGCKTVTKNVGVQELEKGYFHITPNPNLGLFTIECGDISDGSQATLYDILGNKIKTFSLQAHCKQMIDIQDLPNAVYLLQVKNEKSSISFKLVKNGE